MNVASLVNNMDIDVTSTFENYRECARHIRNSYFSTRESKDWDVVEDFDEVDRVLFQRLVLYRLADNYDSALERAVPENCLLIVPSSQRMPLMISREKKGGYWDYPLDCIESGDAQIAFREYFDWDQHGLIDFRYYRGLILSSAKHPEITGHEVLIETIYGRILYAPKQEG